MVSEVRLEDSSIELQRYTKRSFNHVTTLVVRIGSKQGQTQRITTEQSPMSHTLGTKHHTRAQEIALRSIDHSKGGRYVREREVRILMT